MAVSFLTVDEVLAIHAHQISRYGGSPGIRDVGLLESALAMPRATFSGQDLHATLHEKAAAYLFHLVKNHPFIDGNKRVGLAVCLVFLALNGKRIRASDEGLVDLVLGVARGDRDKPEVAVFLKKRAVARLAR
jgi:death on curing protein